MAALKKETFGLFLGVLYTLILSVYIDIETDLDFMSSTFFS